MKAREMFYNRIDEIFKQGNPTKAQIADAFNKVIASELSEPEGVKMAEEYNNQLCYIFSVHSRENEDRKDRDYYAIKAPDEKTAKEKLIEVMGDEIDDIIGFLTAIPFEFPGFNYPSQFQQPITDEMIEKIINDEPELPGIMPDEIWLAAQDKQSLSEVLRLAVRETKNGILNRYKSLSLKAQKDESKTIDHCIILHSGRPLRNRIFTSVDSARNYIKMQYSKRKFSEPEANIFMDKSYGAKFEIVTLNSEA